MMSSTHTLSRLLLLSILMPSMALAYETPEDVLSNPVNMQFFEPPPIPRNAQETVKDQQARNAMRRAEEHQANYDAQHPSAPVEEEPEPEPAPQQAGDPSLQAILQLLNLNMEAQLNSPEAVRQDRIVGRVDRQQDLARLQAEQALYLQSLGLSPAALHSGAPLAHTGPASIVASIVVVAAGLETLRRARKMEKKSL